ncbi:MAG: hypothetical protein GX447_09710 [Elusimicrobia bacterium]|nr:hypothetical protein [Elusimicrobiota bacterium]
MKIKIFSFLVLAFSISAYSQEYDEKYFEISSVKTTVSSVSEKSENFVLKNEESSASKAVPVAAAGAIVNAGSTAWNIINNGQAVGNLSHYYASAVPSPMTWAEVVGWKGPKEIVYTMKCDNLYGITVLDLEYVVSFYYGGNVKGKGQYIANFTVKPRKFDIKWGFKFNMSLQISNPMNVGSAEDPLAYLQADLNWDFSSPLKKTRGFETYAVYGNGRFDDISAKSKELTSGIGDLEIPSQAPSIVW